MILIIKDDWRKQEEPQGILELGEIIMMEDTLNLPASVGSLYLGKSTTYERDSIHSTMF